MTGPAAPVTTSQALRIAQTLHLAFTAAIVIYVVVGEIVRATNDEFAPEGFNDLGGAIWAARAALLLWWLIRSAIVRQVVTDARFIEKGAAGTDKVDDMTIVASMQTAFVLRLAIAESVAILGVVLYFMNSDRLDLYLFPVLALVNLMLLRPTRDRWDEAFREAATRYPGVSSSVG